MSVPLFSCGPVVIVSRASDMSAGYSGTSLQRLGGKFLTLQPRCARRLNSFFDIRLRLCRPVRQLKTVPATDTRYCFMLPPNTTELVSYLLLSVMLPRKSSCTSAVSLRQGVLKSTQFILSSKYRLAKHDLTVRSLVYCLTSNATREFT